MEINKDTFFNYGFYSFTTTNADVFESLKFVKSTNPLNCDETIYGFADGRVFEVLGSKLPARASYINQLFGNELKNYYLREIHVYLLPLARLVAEPGLTLEEMFADFPDMLNYAYSPRMIQKFCTSKDGGDHLFAKENAVGEWYQSMTLEMLLNKFSSFDKNPASLLDYFESCFFEFMRFVPVQYHERIPYKVRENESKKRPLEYVHEPKVEKIVKPPPPKRSRTMVKPEASRGTKSITSFFSPKV